MTLAEALAALAAANNLLARIHRDGGHHTEQVGIVQSCADADAAWLRRELELDATRAELARVTAERDGYLRALRQAKASHERGFSAYDVVRGALSVCMSPANEESGDG